MCLAIPVKIISEKNGKAVVECSGEKLEVIAKGIKIKKGDYAIVQFGMIVQKIPEKEALRAIENFNKLNSQLQ